MLNFFSTIALILVVITLRCIATKIRKRYRFYQERNQIKGVFDSLGVNIDYK